MQTESLSQPTTRIWDLPTRLFHLGFACCVTGAIVTAKLGNTWMDWHVRLGIAALALLIFRITWGFIGTRYARFSQFVRGPLTVWQYIKTISTPSLKKAGHNPLGALSVLAMLAIIGVQAITGLFANDDILTQGPFAQFVSDSTSSLMTGLHQFNEKLVYLTVGLHLIAVLIYSLKGENLVRPMVHGDVATHTLAPNTLPAMDSLGMRLIAIAIAFPLAIAAWWLMQLAANAGSSFN
jgi:cytochrome b